VLVSAPRPARLGADRPAWRRRAPRERSPACRQHQPPTARGTVGDAAAAGQLRRGVAGSRVVIAVCLWIAHLGLLALARTCAPAEASTVRPINYTKSIGFMSLASLPTFPRPPGGRAGLRARAHRPRLGAAAQRRQPVRGRRRPHRPRDREVGRRGTDLRLRARAAADAPARVRAVAGAPRRIDVRRGQHGHEGELDHRL
jgi:hypothetical protein